MQSKLLLRDRIIPYSKLILFALSLLVFISALKNGFVFDDIIHIRDNESIRSWHSAFNLFFEPTFPGDLYRPFTTFTYALNYLICGPNPFSFHLINILLHGAVCVLIFNLLQERLGFNKAFIISLLFAWSPIHVEVVANTVGRAEILAALFGFAFLLCAKKILKHDKASAFTFISASLLLLIALLSKESAAVFIPLAILVFPQILAKTYRKTALNLFATVLAALIVFLTLRWNALGVVLTGASQATFADNPLITLSSLNRALEAFALIGRYFLLCLYTNNLSADYSYAEITLGNFLIGLQYLVAIIGLLFVAVRFQLQTLALGVLWFNLAFLVTANVFFPIGTIFAERLAYLPSLGAYIFLVAALDLLAKVPIFRSKINLVSILLLLLYSFTTYRHASIWRDNKSLWEYQIKRSPNSSKTQANYAVVLRNSGNLDEALIHAKTALQIDTQSAQAAFIQGTIYKEKGLNSAASHWYREALKITPEHVESINALGELMFNVGEVAEAQKLFDRALTLRPNQFEALLGKSTLLLAKGEREEGCKLYTQLKERRPEHPGLLKLSEFGCEK